MTNSRKVDAEISRRKILDATEQLMVAEGYAAVSTRRVAAKAGVKAPLVHYYFKTTDALFTALYLRSAAETQRRLLQALASDHPLEELWRLNMDRERTVLAIEFMALANHREAVRAEIARNAEQFRSMQAGALARVFRGVSLGTEADIARGATLIIAGVARALVMEEALGMSVGHVDAKLIVEALIRQLEPPVEETNARNRSPALDAR